MNLYMRSNCTSSKIGRERSDVVATRLAGHELDIEGSQVFTLEFDNRALYEHRFTVCTKEIKQDGTLGLYFLTKHKINVDIVNRVLLTQNVEVPCYSNPHVGKVYRV